MISVEKGLPRANSKCYVKVVDYLSESLESTVYKFVDCSDGDYFWDSGKEILQSDEVVAWEFE